MPKADVYTVSSTHRIPLTNYAVQTNTHRCYNYALLYHNTIYQTIQDVCFTKDRTQNIEADIRENPKCLEMSWESETTGKWKKLNILLCV